MELLSRLFAVVDKMEKGQYRNVAGFYIATAADALKNAKSPIRVSQTAGSRVYPVLISQCRSIKLAQRMDRLIT